MNTRINKYELKRIKRDMKRLKKIAKNNQCDYLNLRTNKHKKQMILHWSDGVDAFKGIYAAETDNTGYVSINIDNFIKVIELVDDDIIDINITGHIINIAGFEIEMVSNYDLGDIISDADNLTLLQEVTGFNVSDHKKIYKTNDKYLKSHLICINFNNNGMYSTDARRMLRVGYKYIDNGTTFNYSIKHNIVEALPTDFVILKDTDNIPVFKFGDTYIKTVSISDFPDCDEILAQHTDNSYTVDHAELKKIVSTIKKIKNKYFSILITDDDTDKLIISASDEETPTKYKKILLVDNKETKEAFTNLSINFNTDYFLDMLYQFDPKKTGDKKITLRFTNHHRPLFIKTGDREACLMPVRI